MNTAVTDATVEGRMEQGLLHIRDWLATPLGRAAFLAPDETGATRRVLLDLWRQELSATVLKIDADTFSRLIGPLCLDAMFAARPTSNIAVRNIARLTLASDICGLGTDSSKDLPKHERR
ncbi:hypothetical protein [Glaciihabitans sp. dw_435]|uniref:hypothetical protein n=1 Tax=Glaciihabitans sp. dw_435 TaxID=2720081 RepID=UPI001BD29ED6|nr:hypothetical protein [Glaciihabitans sp. dw_435]